MRATVTAHRDYRVAAIDDRLYGAFLEHLGRAVYTGIYEPGHPTADANGMRRDVIDLVRELNIPLVRYPGGNFVSAYNWEDGVGPRDKRPTRLDLAWHTSESNAVGVHEFAEWCAAVGTEMMLAINLGSRGLDEARNFVEYVNGPTGSYWGDLRKANGRAEPFGVKHWCLGNEMDGPWQVGHKTAHEYGRLANEVAKTLRAFDPSLELIVCGSSNSRHDDLSRMGAGRARALLRRGRSHLAAHVFRQPREEHGGIPRRSARSSTPISARSPRPSSSSARMKRSRKKRVTISFDEWNVWYHSNAQDREMLAGAKGWPHAPPPARGHLQFRGRAAGRLHPQHFHPPLGRRADRLHRAARQCHRADHDRAQRRSLAADDLLSLLFRLACSAAAKRCSSASTRRATIRQVADNVPYLDISGVHDAGGRALTFFAVNRHADEAIDLEVSLAGLRRADAQRPPGDGGHGLEAANTRDAHLTVTPKKGSSAAVSTGCLTAKLPPYSYQMIRLSLS